MSKSEPRSFDFREIATLDDTAESFRNWIAKSSSFFSDFWGEVSGYSAQLALGAITTESYGTLLEGISKDDLCCLTELEGQCSSLWYASAAQLRVIVAELLALPEPEEASDEPLTQIEFSLVQLVIDHLASALSDGWMGADDLKLKNTVLERDPRKSRLFRGKDLVTKTSVKIEMKAGTACINWLLPKQKMSDLLETTIDRRAKSESISPSAELIQQLPVELVSALGKARLPMSQLTNISVGQLIMLDQRIDQPITAYVDNEPYYECWPGKLGSQQALEVAACLHG